MEEKISVGQNAGSFSRYYREDDIFPTARSAVDVISKLESLDAAILEQLQTGKRERAKRR